MRKREESDISRVLFFRQCWCRKGGYLSGMSVARHL